MGLFDKAKKLAQDTIEEQKAKISDDLARKKEEKEYAEEQKRVHAEKQNELKNVFIATKKLGDVEIDERNKLVKFKNASSDIKNKSMGKLGKATLAVMTYGASLAIEYAMKPDDVIFRFDEIKDYDLYENDESITSGGLGRAVAGGIMLGGVGAIVGGVTGKRKTKKTVDNMHLHITTTEMFFPSIMIPYINKEVKTKSNDYTKALSRAKETISCLDIIFDYQQNNQTQEQSKQTSDSLDQLHKLKELLDMGILTQEEFDAKKKEILGL